MKDHPSPNKREDALAVRRVLVLQLLAVPLVLRGRPLEQISAHADEQNQRIDVPRAKRNA